MEGAVNLFDAVVPPPAKPGAYVMRDYQQHSTTAAVDYLKARHNRNGILVLPGGAGKSIVIANIVKDLGEPTLIFQPSKELLAQNVEKYRSYGYKCGIYSASAGVKRFDDVTFAMIGSVINKKEALRRFKYILVDEAHLVGNEGGYASLIDHLGVKVIGLTATPYRLGKTYDQFGNAQAILKFLTRTKERVFSDVVHYVQNQELFDRGYLCPMEYFDVPGIQRNALQVNSTGADFTDASVEYQFENGGMYGKIVKVVNRLMETGGNQCLVFTKFTKEAEILARAIPNTAIVTAKTKPDDRKRIIDKYREGRIKCIANVSVLAVGFDHPPLDNVVIARPLRSLGLFAQMIYRCARPHASKKKARIVDMGGNLPQFGEVRDLELSHEGGWHYRSNGRQLTNIPFGDKFKARR